MYSITEFAGLLALLETTVSSTLLTHDEKADIVAVAREGFSVQAHDPRLARIVDRLTTPAAPAPTSMPKGVPMGSNKAKK